MLYEAYGKGEESPLPELGIQYGDFAIWQREWLQGEVLEEQVGYWRKQLAGLERLELPTTPPGRRRGGIAGRAVEFELGEELTCGAEGAEPARGSDVVHGAAGELAGAAGAVCGAEGHGGGNADVANRNAAGERSR